MSKFPSIPGSTLVSRVMAAVPTVFADVRCNRCGRLLFRWEPTDVATVNVKCPRCGLLDTLVLSTG